MSSITGSLLVLKHGYSLHRTVYVTIASAFGVSLATENTNVAQNIGKVFINISLAIGGQVCAPCMFY